MKPTSVRLNKLQCPECNSQNIKVPMDMNYQTYVDCKDCGFMAPCVLVTEVPIKNQGTLHGK